MCGNYSCNVHWEKMFHIFLYKKKNEKNVNLAKYLRPSVEIKKYEF